MVCYIVKGLLVLLYGKFLSMCCTQPAMNDFSFCQEHWDSSFIFGVDSLLERASLNKPVDKDQKSDADVFCIK